jgi:hypothetical protein
LLLSEPVIIVPSVEDGSAETWSSINAQGILRDNMLIAYRTLLVGVDIIFATLL